jgi:hypothetical protein
VFLRMKLPQSANLNRLRQLWNATVVSPLGPWAERKLRQLVVGAFAARILVMVISFGTNDVAYWWDITQSVSRAGFMDAYRSDPFLNHPPMTVGAVWLLSLVSEASSVPFTWLLKLPAIVADGVSAALLHRIWRRRCGSRAAALASVLFLWSPIAILLSAYHGNTDSVYGALLLASAALSQSRPTLSGATLAAAGQVKLLALVAGPSLLFAHRNSRSARRFLLGCLLFLVPMIPAASIDGPLLVRKVFLYAPGPQWWGISWWIHLATSGWSAATTSPTVTTTYASLGRALVVVGAVALPLISRRRASGPFALSVIAASTYLVFTPGIGVQHLALLVTVLFAFDIGAATTFSALGGAFLLTIYGGALVPGLPLASAINPPWGVPAIVSGSVLWLWLTRLWWRTMRGAHAEGRRVPTDCACSDDDDRHTP